MNIRLTLAFAHAYWLELIQYQCRMETVSLAQNWPRQQVDRLEGADKLERPGNREGSRFQIQLGQEKVPATGIRWLAAVGSWQRPEMSHNAPALMV